MLNEFLTEVNDKIKLIQNSEGLTFGTDALMLAAFVRSEPKSIAAEFGSGSGIISLLLAKREKLGKIYAVEKQPYYSSLTQRNIELNGLETKIEAVCDDVRNLSCEYDVIFTNPPYMKTTSGKRNVNDGKYEARHEVNGDIGEFCRAAAKNLRFGGKFYCVYRPDRIIDLLAAMREALIEPKRIVFVCQDEEHAPSLMLAEGKRGGKSDCKVYNIFLCKSKTAIPTDEAEYIYKNGNFPSRFM